MALSFQQTIQQTNSSRFTLYDKRKIGFIETGNLLGDPVLFCHGFPASRLESLLIAESAQRTGVHIVAVDRPGYGLSDWKADRTLLNWVEDIEQLVDYFGWNRFSVLGVSGGGPYALAIASSLPGRIKALGIVCGLGQVYRSDMLRLMHWPARFGFGTAHTAPRWNQFLYGTLLGRFMSRTPEIALALLTVGLREPDRRVLTRPDIRSLICASLHEGLKPGVQGALLDMRLYAQEWGIDFGTIRVPTTFWHGDADATVPIQHTHTLAACMPHATVRVIAEEGHFSLPVYHSDTILTTLLKESSSPSHI